VVAKIKFCGIMQPGDATVAAEAGAAYFGVVFAAGPRVVTSLGRRPALTHIRPEIVDVSSGVERRPGVKDPDTIARFAEAVSAHSSVV
jgi:phosphoribosylanthranilate isomerase